MFCKHSFNISLEHLVHMRIVSQFDMEHIERKLLDEYKAKLSISDNILPGPIDLKEGWIGEEAGIKLLS